MPVFLYKALQNDGTVAEGQLEAGARHEALRQMEAKGLRPIKLAEQAAGKAQKPKAATPGSSEGFKLSFGSSNKITARMLENSRACWRACSRRACRSAARLAILLKEAASPAAHAKWKEIHDRVVDGMTLADAMAKSPEVFPRVYVAMVEAGETGGFLDVVLNQIADFQAREKEMRAKVMAAMLYPAILLVLALGVLTFLMVFFVPKFQKLFSGFGAELRC